ncbi:MAG TPA: hypothetical protein VK786_05475, partial [bacterium]|nr:hypothetical protein [bacterium]
MAERRSRKSTPGRTRLKAPRSISAPEAWALAGILALAALLRVWHLDRNGFGNTYYSAAVRSMLQSWHNFFFVSFDPAGMVT